MTFEATFERILKYRSQEPQEPKTKACPRCQRPMPASKRGPCCPAELRTQCRRGHLMDDSNTAFKTGSGSRYCKKCACMAGERYRTKRKNGQTLHGTADTYRPPVTILQQRGEVDIVHEERFPEPPLPIDSRGTQFRKQKDGRGNHWWKGNTVMDLPEDEDDNEWD